MKSAINGPTGTCRRNLKFAKRRSRNANHSLRSASVIRARNARAREVVADGTVGRAADSVPSSLAGEGGRERSERPGEGFLAKLPSPASRLRRSAPSPARGEGFGVCLALIAPLHERCYARARATTRATPSKPL